MRVWIDMTASAHVLVFRPLIELMRERGDEVEITARDYAQTLQLLELHGLSAEVIGRHGGRSRGPEGPADDASPRRAEEVGEGPRLRRRTGARLARADDDRPPARHPELDDVRLRVRDDPASARLPRGDEGRRAGHDPARAPRALRRAPTEARAVPGPQGGVLPLRLRARPLAARPLRRRPGARARRPAPAARRLALPPPLEPALPDDARPPRPARERARVRAAAHRGAA